MPKTESHEATWMFSYTQKAWQATCKCGWLGSLFPYSGQARSEMLEHVGAEAETTECICGAEIKPFTFQGETGWMHTRTSDDRCYPDGTPEEQEAKATPYEDREASN